MMPADQQQVDRILAVVDTLKTAARSLEKLHEMDAGLAIAYFDRAPPLDMPDLPWGASPHPSRVL